MQASVRELDAASQATIKRVTAQRHVVIAAHPNLIHVYTACALKSNLNTQKGFMLYHIVTRRHALHV